MEKDNKKFSIFDWLILYSSAFLLAFMIPGALLFLFASLFTAKALIASEALTKFFIIALGGYGYWIKSKKLRECKSYSEYRKLMIPVWVVGGIVFLPLLFVYLKVIVSFL